MSGQADWMSRKLEIFKPGKGGQVAREFFHIDHQANRMGSARLMRLIIQNRLVAKIMGWDWLNDLCDQVEYGQAAVGGQAIKNVIEGLTAEYQGKQEQSSGNVFNLGGESKK